MFWRPKQRPTRMASPSAQKSPTEASDQAVIAALREYSERYYREVSLPPLDGKAEDARRIAARACDIIEQSGLGLALAPTLLEHVKHWPSWAERPDFQQWIKFPCRYIGGSCRADPANKTRTTIVIFRYNDAEYAVRLCDEGTDYVEHDKIGKVELLLSGRTVLGLDISEDPQWKWTNVFAFRPGLWMRDLIEMGAHIDAAPMRDRVQNSNRDAIERVKNIKLTQDSADFQCADQEPSRG